MIRALVILGTRPEAIKLAPLIAVLRRRPNFAVTICSTGQHREMLEGALDFFGITPDVNLGLMTANQNLGALAARAIDAAGSVIASRKPDVVIVQGDTTTALAGALAAFYARVPVAHVEAGLRTWDNASPFPEEINRAVIDQLASLHFAPTETSRDSLLRAGIDKGSIHVTGNTVVDAVMQVAPSLGAEPGPGVPDDVVRAARDPGRKLILVTGHRRESFGKDFQEIFGALADIARRNADVEIAYPVHLNPNVREPALETLGGVERVHLFGPLPYAPSTWLLKHSYMVLTDSGGVQEEAPALDTPVLVMRRTTERPEAIEAGAARLVGVKREGIVREAERLLTDADAYRRMADAPNPFGDGRAATRIADVLEAELTGHGRP